MTSVLSSSRRLVRDAAFMGGFNVYQFLCLRHVPRLLKNAREYERRRGRGRFPLQWTDSMPVLVDFRSQAGAASGHYFHQDLWVAKRIYAARPPAHVDIGSRIDGFVAHLLTFMPVTVIDVRPLDSKVPGLTFARGDLTNLAGIPAASVASLSCLHTIEHVGLGRYGDAIDPDGWLKALRELVRILQPGGRLYLSVPIGAERLVFNAHRYFSPRTILDALPDLRLLRFDAVDDAGDLRVDAPLDGFDAARDSCGIFELTKP